MTGVFPPKTPDPYDGRELDLEIEIHPKIQQVIADALQAGWTTPEILQAIEQLTQKFAMEFAEGVDSPDKGLAVLPLPSSIDRRELNQHGDPLSVCP